jgi:hypothetical protein
MRASFIERKLLNEYWLPLQYQGGRLFLEKALAGGD